jgi:hypothetical protein
MRPLRTARGRALGLLLVLAVGSRAGGGEASADVTPELQDRINQAVDRGSAWLVQRRHDDGSFSPVNINGQNAYPVGVSGLCGLALLASGVSKKDPGMLKTLEYMRGVDVVAGKAGVRSTYDSGILLMFVTEMFRPDPKPEKDPRYSRKVKDPCGLPKEIHDWLADLAAWLVSVQMEDGWWRYPMVPPPDLSNTQYALLGLRAARECGIPVPASCFLKALEKTMAAQQKDGPKVKRRIPGAGPDDKEYVQDAGDRARGWSYQHDPQQLVTGSMTTAAIGSLAICRDALLKPERHAAFTRELDVAVLRSAQDGFTWLETNFAVDKNPPTGAPAWHFYYLYGLERACAFGGPERARIGKHDWYAEGAEYLVGKQKPDGRWSTGALGGKGEVEPSDLCDSAWALLFLKKATRPTVPMPAPVITNGG